ncbi:MAG: DUF6377 domain-containing protein [Prevotellaceae bacterium]|jgi:hypothetical protein|nr:DUF6377 domain-containing protein [Prevotellaceae bacterium]
MKKLIIILLGMYIFCALSFAQQKEYEDMYATLNKREFYVKQKENKIETLKNMLHLPGIKSEQEYKVNGLIYDEYKDFLTDSAIVYARCNILIAKTLNNPVLQAESKLRLAEFYSVIGMYIDALELLASINSRSLPKSLQEHYYGAYQALYEQYSYGNINLMGCKKQKSHYRDSLAAVLDTSSVHYKIICAEKLYDAGKLNDTRNLLLSVFDENAPDTHEKAILAYCIARTYRQEKNLDMAKKYCAMSVIADTKNAIKENASLYLMANLLYDTGDLEQAYYIIGLSLGDAAFCDARFRSIEVSKIFNIIQDSYKQELMDQGQKIFRYFIAILLLAFLLAVTIVYICWQLRRIKKSRQKLSLLNKKLNALNADLQTANHRFEIANDKLSEANHLRERHIGHYLSICSSYIDKLEEYRRMLNKTAATQKIEELFRKLKSTEFLDKELKELYHNFDKTFINMYPDFVKDVNELLLPEEQFVLKPNELLPPELRVYALIKLGITDNAQIASFLRYSMSTVYNYHTKVRNKAAVPREQFEQMIMNIGKFKK